MEEQHMHVGFPLTLLTLNVWGKPYLSPLREKRMNAIAEFLSAHKYDIVCLQEIWLQADYELMYKKVHNALGHHHFFKSGVFGSGLCTFSKYPIINNFFYGFRLNGYPHLIHHGDWYFGKGVGLTQINVEGVTINVYNTHMHAQYSDRNDRYLFHRMTQAFEVANFIRLTSGGADCCLLAGDFNSNPSSLVYRILIELTDLKDTHEKMAQDLQPLGTYGVRDRNTHVSKTFAKTYPFGVRLDYIMLLKKYDNFKIDILWHRFGLPPLFTASQRKSISYSDHEGIATKFRIRCHGVGGPHYTDIASRDSLIEINSRKLNVIEEMNKSFEVGRSIIMKNIVFYVFVVLIAIFPLLILALFTLPFPALSGYLKGTLIPIIVYALFMFIWHCKEMQNLEGLFEDSYALGATIHNQIAT